MELDLAAYAKVMAELAAAGAAAGARAAVLAPFGLDEERWSAIDDAWQARFSEALELDGDGVPELISAYAAAYAAAQRSAAPPISIEDFARVTKVFQASGDIRAALAKAGVTLSAYIQGAERWSRLIASDPDAARRFEEALRSG